MKKNGNNPSKSHNRPNEPQDKNGRREPQGEPQPPQPSGMKNTHKSQGEPTRATDHGRTDNTHQESHKSLREDETDQSRTDTRRTPSNTQHR